MLNVKEIKVKALTFYCCQVMGKAFASAVFSAMILACSQAPALKKSSDELTQKITIDRPVIKNLDDISPDLKKLRHSLVRLRVEQGKTTSYGTGFFYRSKDLLITSQHLFSEKHECIITKKCHITFGFTKNAKELNEQSMQVEVVLQDYKKDLIYLKVAESAHLKDVIPLNEIAKNNEGVLTAAGFFQDQPALTFSQGKSLSTNSSSIIVSAGFSGSPIINKNGQLVGVVSSYMPIQGQAIGLAQFIDNETLGLGR